MTNVSNKSYRGLVLWLIKGFVLRAVLPKIIINGIKGLKWP